MGCLCSHLPQLKFEKAKLRLERGCCTVGFLTPNWPLAICFMIGHIHCGPRSDEGLTSDFLHVPFLNIDDVDEILVSRGFLNWTGPYVPVWYPVHSTHSFTNRKACQLISMKVLGWHHPWHTWLMGDIRPELNSMVSVSHHFSHVMLTSPMSLSIMPSVHIAFKWFLSYLPSVSNFTLIFFIFPQFCQLPARFVSCLLLKLLCIMYSVRNASLYEMPSACKHPVSLKTSSNDLWKYPHHFTESLSLVYSDVKLFVSQLGADTVSFVCKALLCTWDTSQ